MYNTPSSVPVNVPPRPSPPSVSERSAAIIYWSSCAEHYQALGVFQFLAGQCCPFPRSSFAGIHWHAGVAAAIRCEALGGVQ